MAASRTTLTSAGKLLITQSSAVSGHYWIGHFGLAYVPVGDMAVGHVDDIARFTDPAQSTIAQSLTVNGNYIYNIWQGDLFQDNIAPNGYNKNLKKNYRYQLDSTQNNTLVVYSSSGVVVHTYSSNLPVPAPLWYAGVAGTTNDYVAVHTAYTNLVASYPHNAGLPYISLDVRGYNGNATNTYAPGVLPLNGSSFVAWFAENPQSPMTDDTTRLTSYSNYNRYHTPSSQFMGANGMSSSTRLFPIDKFSVLNSNAIASGGFNSQYIASGIRLGLSVDITPSIMDSGWTTGIYSPLTPTQIPCNFKFNRIGIYAVKISKMYKNQSTTIDTYDKLMFDIDPDQEPILFAVIEWDTPQILSEDTNPSAIFACDVDLYLDNTTTQSSLVRDNIVFYNAYEDDSIKYYKNQLLANAQFLHAINEQNVKIKSINDKVSSFSNLTSNSGDVVVKNLDDKRSDSVEFVCKSIDGTYLIRKLRGDGITVYHDATLNDIVIDASNMVVSNVSSYARSNAGNSVAIFESSNQINSSGNNLRISDRLVNAFYEDIPSDISMSGISMYKSIVLSGGITEVVYKAIGTISVVDVNPNNWYSNIAPNKISFQIPVQNQATLRGIVWKFNGVCAGKYAVIVSDSATNTVVDQSSANSFASSGLIPTTIHNQSIGSGLIFEPIDAVNLTSSLAIYIMPIGWSINTTANVTVNFIYNEVALDSISSYVIGNLSDSL